MFDTESQFSPAPEPFQVSNVSCRAGEKPCGHQQHPFSWIRIRCSTRFSWIRIRCECVTVPLIKTLIFSQFWGCLREIVLFLIFAASDWPFLLREMVPRRHCCDRAPSGFVQSTLSARLSHYHYFEDCLFLSVSVAMSSLFRPGFRWWCLFPTHLWSTAACLVWRFTKILQFDNCGSPRGWWGRWWCAWQQPSGSTFSVGLRGFRPSVCVPGTCLTTRWKEVQPNRDWHLTLARIWSNLGSDARCCV